MESSSYLERVIEREQQLAGQLRRGEEEEEQGGRGKRSACSGSGSGRSSGSGSGSGSGEGWMRRKSREQQEQQERERERLQRAKDMLSSLYVSDSWSCQVLNKQTKQESFFDKHIKELAARENSPCGSHRIVDTTSPPHSPSKKKKEKSYKLISKTLVSPSFQPLNDPTKDEREEEIGDSCYEIMNDHINKSKDCCNNLAEPPILHPTRPILSTKTVSVFGKESVQKKDERSLLIAKLLSPGGPPGNGHIVSCDLIFRRMQNCLRRMEESDATAKEDYNQWKRCLLRHPDYIEERKLKIRQWIADNASLNSLCLQQMRLLLPANLNGASLCELRHYLSPSLASRVWCKRVLCVIHMSPSEIFRLQEGDLSTDYTPHGLDEVELRALWAVLPDKLIGPERTHWRDSVLELLLEKCQFRSHKPLPDLNTSWHIGNDGFPSREESEVEAERMYWNDFLRSVTRHPAYLSECEMKRDEEQSCIWTHCDNTKCTTVGVDGILPGASPRGETSSLYDRVSCNSGRNDVDGVASSEMLNPVGILNDDTNVAAITINRNIGVGDTDDCT